MNRFLADLPGTVPGAGNIAVNKTDKNSCPRRRGKLVFRLAVRDTKKEHNMPSGDKGDKIMLGFPGGSAVKNLPANARDTDSILGAARMPYSN